MAGLADDDMQGFWFTLTIKKVIITLNLYTFSDYIFLTISISISIYNKIHIYEIYSL